MNKNNIYQGNCIELLNNIETESIDLIYFDPPFFTQKKHSLRTRDNTKKYEFDDSWASLDEYLNLIESCLKQCKRAVSYTHLRAHET